MSEKRKAISNLFLGQKSGKSPLMVSKGFINDKKNNKPNKLVDDIPVSHLTNNAMVMHEESDFKNSFRVSVIIHQKVMRYYSFLQSRIEKK